MQTIDQIEDLLRRLGASELDAGYASDENGVVRLVFPTPTWEDYLTLAFDEIRQFGATLGSGDAADAGRARRPRAAGCRRKSAGRRCGRYLERLDRAIETSAFDAEDRRMALEDDRQGIGLSRPKADTN